MNLKRLLCTLSGDDYSIITQCDNSIQRRFMAIGGFVAVVFILCFVSSYFTFDMLFHNDFIGIPIATFFAWMITNIYLLLLYTLSKNSFPCKTNKNASGFSLFIRVVFICFIAVIVSKPIENMIFSTPLTMEIEAYKEEQIKIYTDSTTAYFNAETENLKLIIEKQKELSANKESNQLENYTKLLAKKELQKEELIATMTKLVNKSNYYLQSIKILNKEYKFCWLITLFTIGIFLFPAYLKNLLGEQSYYHEIKRFIENRIVKEEYDLFKVKYKNLLTNSLIRDMQYPKNVEAKKDFLNTVNKHNSFVHQLQFSEPFMDAPFNTVRKKFETNFLKEDDLISDLYDI